MDTGWTVRGSNPGGDEIFRTCPYRPWGPPSLLYNGYRVFPGGKGWSGRDADTSSPSSAVVKKEYSYTSTPPMGRTTCTEPQCLYKGPPYLYLYLYSVCRPYGLYRASVPVKGCTFNFTYISTPPMGRTACTELHCLYNGAPLPLPIPLLPLWAVRPVQSLSACTTVHL